MLGRKRFVLRKLRCVIKKCNFCSLFFLAQEAEGKYKYSDIDKISPDFLRKKIQYA
jgi:hypothetical protein